MLKKLFSKLLDPVEPTQEKTTQQVIEIIPITDTLYEDFQACSDRTERLNFLKNMTSRKILKKIIRELDDIELLQQFLSIYDDEGVLSEAKKQLKKLFDIKESTQSVRALRRLEKIIAETEAFAISETWFDHFPKFENMKKEWETFAQTAKEAQEFESIERLYKKVSDSFESRVAEQEIIHKNRLAWDQLCDEIESINIVTGTESEVKTQLTEILARREKLADLPESFAKRFLNRFNFAYEKIQIALEKHKANLLKKEEIFTQLLSSVEAAENLANTTDCVTLAPFKKLNESFNANIKYAYDSEIELSQRFNKAQETVKKRIELHQKELVEKQAQSQNTLDQIIKEACEIVKQQLTHENIKELQEKMNELTQQFSTLEYLENCEGVERFKQAENQFNHARRTLYSCQDQERWASYACKVKLCEVIEVYYEQLSDASDFRDVASALRTFRSDFKQLGPVPREKNEELWQRFNGACNKIHTWLTPRFESEDQRKAQNLEAKTALLDELQKILESEDLNIKSVQKEFDQWLKDYKSIGLVPKDEIAPVFDRYQNLTHHFFAKCDAHYAQVKNKILEAKERKHLIIEDAKKLLGMPWSEGFHFVQQLRTQWKQVGFSGKDNQSHWQAFNEIIQQFFDQQKIHQNDNLTIKLQVCETIENLAKAVDKQTLKERNQAFNTVTQLWRATGPMPDDQNESILKRFKEACDHFYEAQEKAFSALNEKREQAQIEKEQLLAQLESLLQSDDTPAQISERIKHLQAEYKALPLTFKEAESTLREAFFGLCDTFFKDRKAQFESAQEKRLDNLKKKREICMQLELLAHISAPRDEAHLDLAKLAEELQYALTMNTMQHQVETQEERINQALELQDKWRAIGPVPKEETQLLYDRYRRACDVIFKHHITQKKQTQIEEK